MTSDTLIIIPAYNEARSISRVVSEIKKLYPDIATIVVDDGSSDKTSILAKGAGAKVLSHPFNMGYGAAIQTGYKYAYRSGFDYVVQIDGDGQHDPKSIKALLDNLKDGSCDIVFGSRFLGPNDYRTSIYRITGIRFFRAVLRLFSGCDMSDPTTGFQAMNRKVLNLFVQDIFPYDYPDADIMLLLSRLNFKMKEVPVLMHRNLEGKSMHKGPFNAVYYVFKMLLAMVIAKFRRYDI